MNKWSVFIAAVMPGGDLAGGTGKIKRAGRFAGLLGMLMWPVYATAMGDMSVDEVLAEGCQTTPSNFSLNKDWNEKMGVIEAWCKHPTITDNTIPGNRKPKAFIHGSESAQHGIWAAGILSGTGEGPDDLGIAPRTDITFGLYCTNASPLVSSAEPGDVVFSIKEWDSGCQFVDPVLPTIPVIGIDNEYRFIGDTKYPFAILISAGLNYGRAVDYFTTGGGLMSFALPEFAGIVIALNTALITAGRDALTISNIKPVLDASSDEVMLEVNGFRGVYKEDEVDTLLEIPGNKYLGQIVNLTQAIHNVLNVPPELTLVKKVVNDSGGMAVAADFPLKANGSMFISGIAKLVSPGVYTLSEINVPGYTASDWVCTGGGSQLDVDMIELSMGQKAVCTITNTDDPSKLTIVKVIESDNGGTAKVDDFDVSVDGQEVDWSNPDSKSGGSKLVTELAATYTLSEVSISGYLNGAWHCSDNNGPVSVSNGGASNNASVAVGPGQEVMCTITNTDDPARLSIVKVIKLDDGGRAVVGDFDVSVDGAEVPWSDANSSTGGNEIVARSADTYTLSEIDFTGYNEGSWSCSDDLNNSTVGITNEGASGNADVTVNLGQAVTCTITNDDIAPELTIIKHVENDNGGNAIPAHFTLRLLGGNYAGSVARSSGDSILVNAHTEYTLDEDPLPGYTQTGIVCKDDDTAVVLPHPVTLVESQSVSCTISNDDDPPSLNLIKEVINDEGGDAVSSDFTLRLSGGDYDASVARSSGDSVEVDANTIYTLGEDLLDGYAQTDIECKDDDTAVVLTHPVSLDEGQSATCTISNDDIAPELTIVKHVTIENGGKAVPGDFILHIFGGVYNASIDRFSDDLIIVDANTEYTLSEEQRSGYRQTGIACEDDDTGFSLEHPVTLDEGQSVTCTISNRDREPEDCEYYSIKDNRQNTITICL